MTDYFTPPPAPYQTFTLKTFAEALEKLPPDLPVLLDGQPVGPYHSWRGDYSEIALGWQEWDRQQAAVQTVGELLAATRGAIGETFDGWKGGLYTMFEWTNVYAEQLGKCSGRRPCRIEVVERSGQEIVDILTVDGPE